MVIKAHLALLLVVVTLLLSTQINVVDAAECTQAETLACVTQSGFEVASIFCLTTDPSTCNPTPLCDLPKWQKVVQCAAGLACSLDMFLADGKCATNFGVCDATFVAGMCGTPAPPGATPVPPTPVPPTPAPPTLPPSSTGVDFTNMVTGSSRPAKLKFGMVGDTTDLLTGCFDVSGADMGFQHVNAKGGAGGTMLEIELDHVPYEDGLAAAEASYNQLLHKDVFAFMQTSIDVSSVVYSRTAKPLNIPMVNPVTAEMPMYMDRSLPMIRTYPTQSAFNILNMAMHGPAKCSRIGIFGLDVPALRAIGDLFSQHVVSMGLPKPASVYTSYVPPSGPEEINKRIDPIFADDDNLPHCVFILMTRTENFYMSYIRRHPKAYKDIAFLLLPVASPTEQMRDAIDGSTSWFKNRVYIIQTFPDPNHPTSKLAAEYRADLAKYTYRTNMTHCPRVPVPVQFEVYAAARFVGEVVSRMTSFSREEFLNTVYRTKMFQIEDLLLGPFNDQCSGLSTAEALTCFCTSGNRGVYASEIDENGMMIGAYDNHQNGEFGTREFYIPLRTCGLENPRQSIALATRFATLLQTGSTDPIVTGLISSLHRIMVGTNRINQQTQRLFRTSPVPSEYDASTTTALAAAKYIGDRYAVVAFVGGSSDVSKDALYMDAVPAASDGSLPTEPLQFNPKRINFVPRLQDHIHALAAFASQSLLRGDSVHIVAETSELEGYARQSVETFGHAPASTSSGDISNGVASAKAGSIVLVVVSTTAGATTAMAAAATNRDRTVLLAASEDHLLASTPALASSGSAPPTNVHFASMFPAFWRTDASTFADAVYAATETSGAYLGVLNRTTLPGQSATPMELRAALQIFLMDTAAAEAEAVTSAAFEDWLYRPTARAARGVSLGPMSKMSCEEASGSLCECNNAVRQIHVHNLTQWFLLEATTGPSEFVFANPNCNVEYEALPSDSLSAAMIGVIVAASVVVVLATGLALVVLATSGRNTAAAPKDAAEPFAMVFTDIQSSTTLWAEVPEAMSEGVETHHTELRKLVAKHNGYEVKTIGDSFMVAFKSAHDATRFALGVQTTLLAVDWGTQGFDEVYKEHMRSTMESAGKVDEAQFMGQTDSAVWRGIRVRVGVHFGQGSIQKDEVTQGYDYYGTVVNTAARVESVGNGGQVLLTEAAYNTVFQGDKEAPADVEVQDMGPQPLRGLPEPVRLFQCTPKALVARKYPPLRIDAADDDEEGSEMDDIVSTGDDEKASLHSAGADYEGIGKDAMTARLVRKGWKDAHAQQAATQRLNDGFAFVMGILATSNGTYRGDFIDHVTTKWRVNYKKNKNAGKSGSGSREEAALVMVLAKVLKSIESKERRTAADLTHSLSESESLSAPSLSKEAIGTTKQLGASGSPQNLSLSNANVQ